MTSDSTNKGKLGGFRGKNPRDPREEEDLGELKYDPERKMYYYGITISEAVNLRDNSPENTPIEDGSDIFEVDNIDD